MSQDDLQPYVDLITGRELPYHDDEYIRQGTEARLLELGYPREDIVVEARVQVTAAGEPMAVRADLLLLTGGRPALVFRCTRGSMVTRERETVACARLLHDPIVPLVVVTNGDDAELLTSRDGKVLAGGLEAIPGPGELARLYAATPPHHASAEELEKAARIYTAYAFIQCPGQCRA